MNAGQSVRVSVVIPTRDRKDIVTRAITSALAQSLSPYEVIVVDDGSVDGTSSTIESQFPGCVVLRHEHSRNGAAARNTGIGYARGDVIAFLDSDDWWLPGHLSCAVNEMRRTAADGVASSFRQITSAGNEVDRISVPGVIRELADYVVTGRGDVRTSGLVVKAAQAKVVLFDEALEKHQDWDFAIRFSERFLLTLQPKPTFIIDASRGDRMSADTNPGASRRFLEKHVDVLSETALFHFYAVLIQGRALARKSVKEFLPQLWRHRAGVRPKDLFRVTLSIAPGGVYFLRVLTARLR